MMVLRCTTLVNELVVIDDGLTVEPGRRSAKREVQTKNEEKAPVSRAAQG